MTHLWQINSLKSLKGIKLITDSPKNQSHSIIRGLNGKSMSLLRSRNFMKPIKIGLQKKSENLHMRFGVTSWIQRGLCILLVEMFAQD